ncbi:hypothetical protein T484DRAFT_1776632 [Baffinella frigidus]|nr:hypothetical protein T484DRAFT_1776632 [Cryptophyta sp. CCMP2293]
MQNEVQTEADNVISGAWLEWNSTDLPSSVVREVLRFYGPWMNDNAHMGDRRDCLFTKFRDCPPAFRNVVRLQLAIHYRLHHPPAIAPQQTGEMLPWRDHQVGFFTQDVGETMGRAFARQLRDAATIERGARPYPCGTCGKAFTTSGNRTRHMREHTGARPYSCDTCGKAFTNSDAMTAKQVGAACAIFGG